MNFKRVINHFYSKMGNETTMEEVNEMAIPEVETCGNEYLVDVYNLQKERVKIAIELEKRLQMLGSRTHSEIALLAQIANAIGGADVDFAVFGESSDLYHAITSELTDLRDEIMDKIDSLYEDDDEEDEEEEEEGDEETVGVPGDFIVQDHKGE